MTTPHYELGYNAHVYFDHTQQRVFGTIVGIKRRFGFYKNGERVGKLIHLRLDKNKNPIVVLENECNDTSISGNVYTQFDESFIVKASPPKRHVHYNPSNIDSVHGTYLVIRHWRPTGGYIRGSLDDVLRYAFYTVMARKTELRRQKETLGLNYSLAGSMFTKDFNHAVVNHGWASAVSIKKKILLRWMHQNINRLCRTVKELDDYMSQQLREDEEQYERDMMAELDTMYPEEDSVHHNHEDSEYDRY